MSRKRGRAEPPEPPLRRLAEERLAEERLAKSGRSRSKAAAADVQALVHELEVHRIELELQNEQLRQSQAALEESNDALARSEARYRDLYDSAPVAYLSLDSSGTIRASNLTAARLLGVRELAGRSFADFVARSDQDEWFLRRGELAEHGGPVVFELGLEPPERGPLRVQAVASAARGGEEPYELRLAIADVTERWRVQGALREAALREALAEQRERRRLAEALHDDVGQVLSLASMKLAQLADGPSDAERASLLSDTSSLVADAGRRIGSLSFELYPTILYDVGLVAAAEWLAQEIGKRYELRVRVGPAEELDELDEAARSILFRALREFLVNVAKHAQTERAEVRIRRLGTVACVEVEDEGVGFREESVRGGFGLLSLRRRVRELGGSIDVVTKPGDGTKVTICVPIRSGDACSQKAGS